MTNMTNDSVIFREREFLEIPKNKFIFIYNINIIYKYGLICEYFNNPLSQNMTPSFVIFVMFTRAFLLLLIVKFALL